MFNYLLLYLLLIIIMIIFAHILDRYSCKKIINNDSNEGFDMSASASANYKSDDIIGAVFKLKFNLPHLKTYIQNFNENVAKKYFYLAFVKLNPNCDIINVNNSCVSVYIDE